MPNPDVLTGSNKDETTRHTRNHSNSEKLHTRPVDVFTTLYVLVLFVCVQSVDEWLLP